MQNKMDKKAAAAITSLREVFAYLKQNDWTIWDKVVDAQLDTQLDGIEAVLGVNNVDISKVRLVTTNDIWAQRLFGFGVGVVSTHLIRRLRSRK